MVLRSPRTGDFGFENHPWLRLEDRAIGLNHPAVMFDLAELRGNGYDPRRLGLVRIGDHTGNFLIPVVDVVADMKSRFDVDLYQRRDTDLNNPVPIIGGVFGEPHPDEWWDRVHGEQDLFIVAGDTPTFANAVLTGTPLNFGQLWADSYIGRVSGLMIRAYDDGVGTKMPGE